MDEAQQAYQEYYESKGYTPEEALDIIEAHTE